MFLLNQNYARVEMKCYPLCEEFGPFSLACTFISVAPFAICLKEHRARRCSCILSGRRFLMNIVFLLGVCMLMFLGSALQRFLIGSKAFQEMQAGWKTFRDLSPGAQNFHL